MRGCCLLTLAILSVADIAWSCDLCAIYNADAASGSSGKGFSFTVSEQFIPYGTQLFEGEELPPSILDEEFLDRSMTHLVPSWRFSDRFGVSVNIPIIYENFTRLQLSNTGLDLVSGEETGLGDVSLVGQVTPYRGTWHGIYSVLNLLAGVKFPTGDASFVKEEVEFLEPGHVHGPTGVHLRDLALGSGSYDGVFGATANSRWTRLFINTQGQYYLRTPGEAGYEYGDEWMVSGGPGVFLALQESFTFSLQVLATYDVMERDRSQGQPNPNTGMRAVYLGPVIAFTIGERFSANIGADFPLLIENNGLQNVPDYRLHFGATVRF